MDYLSLRKFEVDELNVRVNPRLRAASLTARSQAFLELYDNFLVDLGPALEATIRHIIDDPEHPPLIHCTGQSNLRSLDRLIHSTIPTHQSVKTAQAL